jgi:Ca-activated chloride channel family protein
VIEWLPLAVAFLGALASVTYVVAHFLKRPPRLRPALAIGAALAAVLPCLLTISLSGLADIRQLRLERPWLALPVAFLILASLTRLERLSPRQSRFRRTATEVTAVATLLLAGLAVTGLELGRPLDRLSVLIAVDRSRSIDLVPGADARIAAELRVAELGMRDEDRIGTLAFGTSAAVEDPLRPRSRLAAPQRAEVGRDGTDLAAALRHALGEVPADSSARIVLVTDGVATRGDTLSAALAAVAAGVPVDAVPLDQAKVPDVRVTAVRMPSRASEGEPLELRVVTASSSPARVEVRVLRDGVPIRSGKVDLAAGEDVLHLRELAPAPGFHRYDVELSAEDPALDRAHEDNEGSAFVRVQGQASALVLEREPALAGALVRSLESAAFRVDVRGATGIPADVAGFAAYDLVALSDIPASDLSPSQMEALASYVRDLGGGLLLLGSDKGLGPGGYGKTPIEEVSPVSFDVKQERRRASLAEIIAVDYSGSMGAQVGRRTKLDLANEAAVRSADLLGSGDRLGVMHVDTTVRWTVPLGPIKDKAALARDVRAVGVGGGGIYVDLTLSTAYEALARENVQLKHCLLFSDGADAEERTNAIALVTRAKANGITTSVVALGNGSDVPDLERMSLAGGGRFYLIEDATRLPAVFAQETVLASRSAINEVTFRPTLAAPGPAVRGIDFTTAPPLTGYVVSIPKARTLVHLTGPEGDPLLAVWSAGVGRSAVFTSDFKDRWGLGWTSWEGAARLFGQVARDVARRADDPNVRLQADTRDGVFRLQANVVNPRGRAETFRRLRATVAGPDGFSQTIQLEATGSGSYAGALPLDRPGAYVATAIDEDTGAQLGIAGASLSAGEELRPTGTDRALLTRITEQSGGKLRDTLAGIFEDRPPRRFAYSSVAPVLALAAAFLLLLMVAARRLAVPEFVTTWPRQWRAQNEQRRAIRDEERARRSAERAAPTTNPRAADTSPAAGASPAVSAPEASAASSLDALRQAKARSRATTSDPHAPSPAAPARAASPLAAPSTTAAAAPTTAAAARSPAPVAAPSRDTSPPSSRGPRQLSAAEILLQRRKGRKS